MAAGRSRYFTGNQCPRGHVAERYVSTMHCVVCVIERAKVRKPESIEASHAAYRAANPEKVRQWKRESQKRNRAAANARNRRYAAKHREQIAAKCAAWARSNPDKEAAKIARRRAAMLHQTPSWADHQAIGMMYRAAQVCRESGFDVHVDHIVPLQGKGVAGLHVHQNLQIIHAQANRSKSNIF